MEQIANMVGSRPVCGVLQSDPTCICIRDPGHWSSHVITANWETFFLCDEGPMPIQFKIEKLVALRAMEDPNWTWEE